MSNPSDEYPPTWYVNRPYRRQILCSPKPVNLKYCAPVNLRWVHRAVCTTKYTHSTMCTRLAVGAQCNVYYTGTHSTLCAQNWQLVHSPMCTTNYTMCSITLIKKHVRRSGSWCTVQCALQNTHTLCAQNWRLVRNPQKSVESSILSQQHDQ